MNSDHVILVDMNDKALGSQEKLQAHKQGNLHRAFSILVFNSKNELLIHQREKSKYHCGGLWTNTCCSHPQPGEDTETAAHRRLQEEMGFTCKLEKQFTFIYKELFGNGLTEHELDHVFFGQFDGIAETNIQPDPKEVMDYKWISMDKLRKDMQAHPEKYTTWFKEIVKRM